MQRAAGDDGLRLSHISYCLYVVKLQLRFHWAKIIEVFLTLSAREGRFNLDMNTRLALL